MAESTATKPSDAATNTELAMRRTGMSFQRTRMSADRTLMAEIRTSLALITFGFTIHEGFARLRDAGILRNTAGTRYFGISLLVLGIGMLALGIIYHLWFMWGLRTERITLKAQGLIHAKSVFPPSLTLIVALSLLAIGVIAAASALSHTGPFK
jgi:putative membrane protein